jgi:ABC-type antimicrobial peptide transport system permease subunit
VTLGIVAGAGAAWILTRFLRALLFEIAPTDPPTYAIVAILTMLVAAAAYYVPARRAARVDPMVVLRND